MTHRTTRRHLLAGLASVLASPVLADGPLLSPRPQARPGAPVARTGTRPAARATLDDLIAASGLGGTVSVVLADLSTGRVVESASPGTPLPPASVAKAVTALYALETLGPAYRFETRVLATGPVTDGIVQGDLVLAGGGDPTLDSDDLLTLAQDLRAAGITGISGALLVWGGALQGVDEIEPGQMDHLGYNPALSGLNLNFNRVHFAWRQTGGEYATTMDGRTENIQPSVVTSRVEIANRDLPVFDYRSQDGIDIWSVARSALGAEGSRWLPVRNPAVYAGDVFRRVAAEVGLVLPPPAESSALPAGNVMARHQSAPLVALMRDMLLYSTNLTAEAVGMAASAARAGAPRGLRTSALAMSQWAQARGGIAAHFADHSGLSDATRVSAEDMVRLLLQPGVHGTLWPVLKTIPIAGVERGAYPGQIRAKTGTLNFVTTLAGYVRGASGRDLAFAIFAADLPAREASRDSRDELPPGAEAFNTAARRLQQDVLRRWSLSG